MVAKKKGLYLVDNLRECSKCHEIKERTEFFKHSQRSDGLHSWCKSCCKKGNKESLRKKYSNFEGRITTFLRTCKASAEKRGQEFSLTRNDLIEMWETQEGICAYTGIEMTTQPATSVSVSVERVNNNIGYTKDNTILVCNAVNRMKSNFSGEEFFSFCKAVVDWLGDENNELEVEFKKYG
jgi:hypothetical protein